MSITIRDLKVEEKDLSEAEMATIVKLQDLSKQSATLRASQQDIALLYQHYEQALYNSVAESQEEDSVITEEKVVTKKRTSKK
tara:strand:- start:508 stop:756 length:249 start_codon:yes stop_codon:yes gene_type:complete